MALKTDNYIKVTIKGELRRLKESVYPDDIIRELADSVIPIYYNEIINDWCGLSPDYSDRWKVENYEGDRITDLMAYDLSIYYSDKFFSAWHEIKEELEIE
jgi:hypothetical protein